MRDVLENLVWEAMKEGQKKNYLQPKDREYGVNQALTDLRARLEKTK